MNTCEKCGAYIPIGETACPACGYDPAENERRAKEEARRKAAEEARRRAAEAEAERRRAQAAREEEQRRQQGGGQYAYQTAPEQESTGQTWSAPWEQQRYRQPQYARPMNYRQPRGRAKNKWVAFFLCMFTGWFGGHKFYEGKWGMGLLYLFTYGLFGVGWIVDLIRLLIQPDETYYVE